VTTRFLIIAAVMVVVALACVLVPMLRSAQREGRPRAPFVLALVLALTTPPVVLGLYLMIGTPQALQAAPAVADRHADLVQATEQLKANLAKKPDDTQGWALLAQAYSALNQPREALGALDHLLKLQPANPDVMVAWVEAHAEASDSHLIGDAGRAELAKALAIDPTHQRALWLLGISDYQRQDFAGAAANWKTLLPLLEPGSKVAQTVQQQLADAQSRAGGAAAPVPEGAASAAQAPASAIATASRLNVTVKLDPKLADRLRPGDVLYVFARAVGGPAMPLAVAKLHPSRIPVEVTLTDQMAVSPTLTLSKFAKVQVAARISRTGAATPGPGDLESSPVEVATATRGPVAITIDKVSAD
jgi:cytochrome c-type biogenesis protein CcmH